jgi:hypothetical protein
MVQPTPLSKKYGISTSYPDLAALGKSGITPIDPAFDNTQAHEEVTQFELRQRWHSYGFSTRDLLDAGSIVEADAQPCNLSNPLHPIFERERWQTEPLWSPANNPARRGEYQGANSLGNTLGHILYPPRGTDSNSFLPIEDGNQGAWEVSGRITIAQ